MDLISNRLNLTLALAIAVGVFVGGTIWCFSKYVGMPSAIWLIIAGGALGGLIGSFIANKNRFILAEFQNTSGPEKRSICLGTIGDVIVGIGGAIALGFLFGERLLNVDLQSPDKKELFLLASVSLVAGTVAPRLILALGQSLLARVATVEERASKIEKEAFKVERLLSDVERQADHAQKLVAQVEETAKRAESAAGESGFIALLGLTALLTNECDYETAHIMVERVLKIKPENARALFEKARVLKGLAVSHKEPEKRQKKLHEAIALLERVAEQEPDRAPIWFNMACYEALAEKSSQIVLEHLGKAVALDPFLKKEAWDDGDLRVFRQKHARGFKRVVDPQPKH